MLLLQGGKVQPCPSITAIALNIYMVWRMSFALQGNKEPFEFFQNENRVCRWEETSENQMISWCGSKLCPRHTQGRQIPEVNAVACQMLQVSLELFLTTVLHWPLGLREDATWTWSLLLINFHLSSNFDLQGISAGARQTWYLLCPSSSHPCHCCSH